MIVVAYGANLDSHYGDPVQTFDIAKQKLNDSGISVIKSSCLYDTSPVGTDENQPWYTNAVLQVQTVKTSHDLMDTLLTIETDIGRIRTTRNAPRVIDLDLIAYDNITINDDRLTLPHPRMHERKFVLQPLCDIAPSWHHPLFSKTADSLLQSLPDDQKIKKIK